jgi:hypothetical protein
MGLRDFLNQRVVICNQRSTRYAGVLLGFRRQETQFCLGTLDIVNRAGAYTVSGAGETRWFDTNKFQVTLESKTVL